MPGLAEAWAKYCSGNECCNKFKRKSCHNKHPATSRACLDLDDDCGLLLKPTFCIAAGGDIEKRLPGGNDEKKYDDEINEKFFRKSQATNQSW